MTVGLYATLVDILQSTRNYYYYYYVDQKLKIYFLPELKKLRMVPVVT